jgi:dihydroorotate dehydrogenase (NAD+) catalytic subunit
LFFSIHRFISSGKDAIEMIMAGATAIGIGSAVYEDGFEAFGKIVEEMKRWMEKNNIGSIKEIIGAAHE